jgi:Na+/phosphate symporter
MSFDLKILTRNVLNIGVFGVFVAPTLLGGVMSYKNGRGFVSGALIGSAVTGSVMALVCGITYKVMCRIMEGRVPRALNNAIPLQQAGLAVVQAHFGGMEEQVPKG